MATDLYTQILYPVTITSVILKSTLSIVQKLCKFTSNNIPYRCSIHIIPKLRIRLMCIWSQIH